MFSMDAMLCLKLCSQETLYLKSTDSALNHRREMVVERLVPKNVQWTKFHNCLWTYSIVCLGCVRSLHYKLVTALGSTIRHPGIDSRPTCKSWLVLLEFPLLVTILTLCDSDRIMRSCKRLRTPALLVPKLCTEVPRGTTGNSQGHCTIFYTSGKHHTDY